MSQSVMNFYTDDSPGIKIPPVGSSLKGREKDTVSCFVVCCGGAEFGFYWICDALACCWKGKANSNAVLLKLCAVQLRGV